MFSNKHSMYYTNYIIIAFIAIYKYYILLIKNSIVACTFFNKLYNYYCFRKVKAASIKSSHFNIILSLVCNYYVYFLKRNI